MKNAGSENMVGPLQDLAQPLRGGPYLSQLSVGAVSLLMTADRDIALGKALHPFRTFGAGAGINLQIEWLSRISSTTGSPVFDSGCTWKSYECNTGLQFDFYSPAVGHQPYKRLLTDSDFRGAILQMSEECIAKLGRFLYPLGYPLDELLIVHRLTQEEAIELHGCGIVGADGVGNLFVGHSGAGKSTTTRLWTESEDVEILSDDRIIVRRGEGKCVAETPLGAANDAEPEGILRLRDCSASRTSPSAQDDRTIRMYGTPWHGEAMYASPSSAPLTRILVLDHGQGNVLTRLSPSQAVAELFARSFVPMHRHEYVESALEFLEDVADSIPCYRYAFEPDQKAVDTILNFHD
jgi:hypothetical protein